MLPQIWGCWLKSYLMQLCKPCHYTLIEAVEPFKLIPCPWHTFMSCLSVCVCVNLTSRGEETLATPAYQGWLARVLLPLGAAVNKIKGATLTPPNAQARALRVSASLAPGSGVQMVSGSVA
jgi:hypothetical protein